MIPRPPRSTRPDTLFPYTTLFRSQKTVHVARGRHPDLGMPGDDAVEQRAPVGVGPVAQAGAEAFGVRPRHADIIRVEKLLRRQLALRSEEHTSELQSLMRISYAVFCLKKKTTLKTQKI